MLEVRWELEHPELLVGLVEAVGVRVMPTPALEQTGFAGSELEQELREELARVAAGQGPAEATRRSIRELLRRGGFKPTGRSKPASEYLAQAAAEGRFPRINNLVDINNLLSLRTGWPMSLLDLERIAAGRRLTSLQLRFGRAGEQYVFNRAGQAIELRGLVCLATGPGEGGDEPVGNPVKDSLAAKTEDRTSHVLAVLYTSKAIATPTRVREVAEQFGHLLIRCGGATRTELRVLPEP